MQMTTGHLFSNEPYLYGVVNLDGIVNSLLVVAAIVAGAIAKAKNAVSCGLSCRNTPSIGMLLSDSSFPGFFALH